MSAWIVEKGHIDVLVQGMVQEGVIPMADRDDVGTVLWRENRDSVNYRYNGGEEVDDYKFHGVEAPLNWHALLRAASCYEYQSCEHPTWDDSRACELIVLLQNELLEHGCSHDDPEYAAYPWGFEQVEQAVAV